jgi:hypothetical protein
VKRLVVSLVLACAAIAAQADGGRLQMRRGAGPFVVSLFTTPESLGVGQADLSAMIEEQAGGKILLDADIVITLSPEDGGSGPIVGHFSHAHATNRLLQDAVVQLPHAGQWHAVIQVNEAGRHANTATDLTVGDYSVRRGTVWVFTLLPACAVALFAWAQVAKATARRRRLLSQA